MPLTTPDRSLCRHRTGWRYVATKDGKALALEFPDWEGCREHVEYLHRAYRGHGHIFGVASFYRKPYYLGMPYYLA